MARPALERADRVRWAHVGDFHYRLAMSWKQACVATSEKLVGTEARGSASRMWTVYKAENRKQCKACPELADRINLAQMWAKNWQAVLHGTDYKTAATAVMKQLEAAGRPMTLKQLMDGSGGKKARAMMSATSRLHTSRKIRRGKLGGVAVYALPRVDLPPASPTCLQALQTAGREMTAQDLKSVTKKSLDGVDHEMRRHIADGKALRVQRAAPGRFAAYALTETGAVLPPRTKLKNILEKTAEVLVVQYLQRAPAELRTPRQIKKATGKSESSIGSALHKLINKRGIFHHDHGLYGLMPPGVGNSL